MKKFGKYLFMVVISFAMPFLSFYAINFSRNYETSKYGSNTTACNIDYEYKIKRNTLKTSEDENKKIALNFCYKNKCWHFDENDFEPTSNIHTIVENFYQSNKKSGYENKLRVIKKIKKIGFGDEIAIKYIFPNIEERLDQILCDIELKPQDAKVSFDKQSNLFVFEREKTGLKVDRQKLFKKIFDSLLKTNAVYIEIETDIVYPSITEDMLRNKIRKQSSFSTNYSHSSFERKNNIKIATNTLNGFMIEPNETFSFNDAIGKRLESKGYLKANIIKDGEFVKGTGGGVCQVSTTLYNALLLAGINVTEVHKHSLPVSYVKPGFDAMVSWGTSDLKFKNTTNYPIFILSNCNGENITFKIFGDTKDTKTTIETSYQISNTIPRQPDKIIPDTKGKYADKVTYKGEYYQEKQGKDGYQVKAYLNYYVDGKLEKIVLIRDCSYAPQQGIKYEGTKEYSSDVSLEYFTS